MLAEIDIEIILMPLINVLFLWFQKKYLSLQKKKKKEKQ